MQEKQQNGLVFEAHNGVELPLLDEDGPNNGTGTEGVDIHNIANHQYLEINPYWNIANNDDDDENTAEDN